MTPGHVGVGAIEIFGANVGADQSSETCVEVGWTREAVLSLIGKETGDRHGATEKGYGDEVEVEDPENPRSSALRLERRGSKGKESYNAMYRLIRVQIGEKKSKRKGRTMALPNTALATTFCSPSILPSPTF